MDLPQVIMLNLPIMGIGIMLSTTIGVLIYMFSKIFNDSGMGSKGKSFLISSIETLFIIVLFILVGQVIETLFSAVIGCTSPNLPSCSPIYLSKAAINRVLDTAISLYTTFYLFDLVVGPFIQSVITFPVAIAKLTTVQISIMPLIGLDIVLDFYYTLMQKLVDMLILIVGRIMLIEIALPLSAYLLPFAVIFRAIPATKRVGSSIFALILVIYYVFPLSILFSDYLIFHEYRTDIINPDKAYNQDILPSYVKENGELDSTANAKLDEYLKNVKDTASKAPERDYTIDESVDRVGGSPLEILKGKATVLVVAPLLASASSFLMNFFPTLRFVKLIGLVINVIWLFIALKNLNPIEWQALLTYSAFYLMISVAQILMMVFIGLIFEILISVTAYRAITKVFGGDVTMLGLTKVI